jgi:asparagine synthase (glutamine-hydrolysing)
MCGIAGIVDWGGRPADAMDAALARMQAAVAHRGPDGAGRVRREVSPGGARAYLAHQRLAIIDRSPAGHQPMASHDGAHWLTYNGEIYNHAALRADASIAGTAWRSSSDSEVLVEGLAQHGSSWLARARGMFAVAWWHDATGRLTLARDRFGIKPLVWAQPQPGLLLFASTPQALAASGLLSLEPDRDCDAELLARGSLPPGTSYWRGVSVVPAGCALEWEAAASRVVRWAPVPTWNTSKTPPGAERPVAKVGREIRAAVLDSVRAHFVSDVPVALFLSGGRDSVALLAAARALKDVPLRTFTVTMPGSPLDEGRQARVAAEYFGAEHTELAVDALDLDEALDAFFDAMAQPSVDGFNTFLVARAARRAGIRVALSGVGGDELFGGYPSFTDVPRLARALPVAGPALRAVAPLMSRWLPDRMAKLSAIAGTGARSTAAVWWEYRGLWSRTDVQAFTGHRAPDMPADASIEGQRFDVIRACEWRQFLERQLLPDADAYTMCHSLELRTPFVDSVLVDAVLAAGRWSRGPAATYKQALFAAWDDMTVPALRDDPKQGFVLPFDAWLRHALTHPRPSHWTDVARRLRVPRYQTQVDRFLVGRLHWSRLWALYVRERISA